MRRILLILNLLVLAINSNANTVDSTLAKIVAKNFYTRYKELERIDLTLFLTEKTIDSIPLYYVFNVNSDDGFVIVSADDAALPILGYSLTSQYIISTSPEFRNWVGGYKAQITYIKENKLLPDQKTIDQWNKYRDIQSATVTTSGVHVNGTAAAGVGPLLSTKWNQAPNYNDLCPSKSVTGCVATAMAQIMKYWNYPSTGTGSTLSYTTGTNGWFVAAKNLAADTYNWSGMPNTISSSNINIATLMYDCGISVQMDYGLSESLAWVIKDDSKFCAQNAYINYFAYNPSTIQGLRRSNYPSTSTWLSMLKTELDNARPIQYVGSNIYGHTWVCDGYDENNLFHMNWGWGGKDDGYYSVDFLNPSSYPSGFSYFEEALIGIQPNCTSSDLLIVNQTVDNINQVPGGTITASCYESNNGHTYAGAHVINLYLSNNSNLDITTATPIKQISVSSVAALSQTTLLSTSFSIPSNISSGQYYLYFVADGNKAINECNENNNIQKAILNIASNSCNQPLNDGCTGSFNATPLIFGTKGSCTNSTASSSCGATSSGFTACAGANADDDVFFQFVPTTSNATITVTPSSGYDAVFQLLSGPCGSNMQSVSPGCVNSNGIGVTETQSYVGLVPGNTYFIRVWHAGAGWGSGNFNICVFGNSCSLPSIPGSLSPGSTSLPGQIITTATPQLSWSTVTGASAYVVHILQEPYSYDNLVYTSGCVTPPFTLPAGILQNGINYSWDVEAFSSCNSDCNNFSTSNYFTTNTSSCTSPTTQASTIYFASVATNQMTITWNSGNGSRRIVKINTLNSFTNPVNGNSPSANNTYSGTGEQVVYNGSESSVIVYGLAPGTNYCVRIYEANCTGSYTVYNISAATNNPSCQSTPLSSCIAPTLQATSLSFSSIGTGSMTINWAIGNGSRRVVKMNTTNSFTDPINGSDPSANSNYQSGEQVIYNGTGNSITVTGLTPNTNYCFKVYEANCYGSSSVYNISTGTGNPNCQSTAACSAPTIQANNITFSNIGLNTILVGWANGNGIRRIVKINTTSSFTSPANSSDAPANSNYSGSGEQVVYNGTGTNVTITGLSPNSTYCFRVYEANCSGSFSTYLTTVSADNPKCQSTCTIVPASCSPNIVNAYNNFDIGPHAVTLNDLAVNSGGYTTDNYKSYVDQSCIQQASLATGKTYSISITTGPFNPENVRVWIDYNNDGIFQDAELVMSHNGTQVNETHTGSFTVPDIGIVTCSKLRMRVMSDFYRSPVPKVCTDLQYGQAEDFSVYITSTPVNNIAITTGGNPSCPGQPVTFTATPVNGGNSPSFQWKSNGINVGTNSATYSTTTPANGDIINCVLTSSVACATSATAISGNITMVINAAPISPVVSISANPTGAVCAGSVINFSATSNVTPTASGGYQWKKNGINTGSNSSFYASSTLVSGDQVTCNLTTNGCVTTSTATSNTIVMSVGAISCTPGIVKDTNSYDIGPRAVMLNDLTVNSSGYTGDNYQAYLDQTCNSQATLESGKSYSLLVKTGLWNPENVRVWIDYNNDGIFQTSELVMSHNGTIVNETHTGIFTVPDNNIVTCTKLRMRVMSDWYQSPVPQPCVSVQYGQTEDYSVYISSTPKVSIALSGSAATCFGITNTFVATPINGGATPSYQWKFNGNNVGTNSSSYSSNVLNNGDIVSCVLTSNGYCLVTSTAVSNPITVTNNLQPTVVITNPFTVCTPLTIDLTNPGIINSTSTPGLSYTYWYDALATTSLTNASAITITGVYYIKGTSIITGCSVIKPVTATINPLPVVNITNPLPVCAPLTVDITASAITSAGSTAGLSYTYFYDGVLLQPLTNAGSLTGSGVYYIKGVVPSTGCSAIKPVTVKVNPQPVVNIINPEPLCAPLTIDLTNPSITSLGSTIGLSYTYWNNALATSPLTNANAVTVTGVYYIKGTIPATGCAAIQSVPATINPLPILIVANPSVCLPGTIDLTSPSIISAGSTAGLSYTYWNDALATSPVTQASAMTITASGVYYIKGTVPITGCAVIQPVTATINPLPTVVITNPSAVCAPLTVDLTSLSITSVGSTAGLSYTYWYNALATSAITNANAVTSTGIYYIKGTIPTTGCGVVKPLTVTVNSSPVVGAITGASQVCVGAFITLNNSVTGGTWTSSDATKASISSVGVVTGVSAGTITTTYSVTNANGCTTTVTTPIVVNAVPPKPTINIAATNLMSSSATGNQWYSSAGIINGATSQTYKPSIDGYYKVQVTISGCSSPVSDPFYYLVTAVANISSVNDGSYQILPNPVSDLLVIRAKNLINKITAQIIDLNGKIAITKTFTANTTISMQRLATGTYSILLTDLKTRAQESKIIIKQ